MKLQPLWSWLGYRLKARSPCAVRSSFMSSLVSEVFRDQNDYTAYHRVAEMRRRLLHYHEVLHRDDLGSGSNGDIRINRFVKSSTIPTGTGKLLFRLVRYLEPDSILELGTGSGLSTAYMMLATPGVRCITLEGCSETARLASQQFQTEGINAEVIVGPFDKTLPGSLAQLHPIEFAFIDGNHRHRHTVGYFRLLIQHCHERSCLAFHDIHWSREMSRAWKTIIADERVTMSIDLFDVGLVFFPEQSKEHFVLRW